MCTGNLSLDCNFVRRHGPSSNNDVSTSSVDEQTQLICMNLKYVLITHKNIK